LSLSKLFKVFLIFLVIFPVVSVFPEAATDGEDLSNLSNSANLIDLELNQVPVSEAFMMLGEASGKNILLREDKKNPETRVSISVHQQSFEDTFSDLLEETGFVSHQVGEAFEVGSPEFFQKEQVLEKEAGNLGPLQKMRVQIFLIKFGNTSEILQVLKDSGWLSPGAKLTMDASLNTLLVQGTPQDITQVASMLKHLDVPPVQVLIEARIVEIDEQAMKAFGVSLLNVGGKSNFIDIAGQTSTGIPDSTGALNLTLGQLPAGISLDLAIQALETKGNGQVVSAPNLLVSDGQSASIEQGSEVPYATESQNGSSQVQFKKAVMGLTVTPRVINNQEVLLNLVVNKDAVSTLHLASAQQQPLINTQQIKTQVRVMNGHTVVLGGIIETNQDQTRRQVPFLGDLPGIGALFRSKEDMQKRKEIVIFVTPTIRK
jgi:type II secretory pathway component HofQ